MIGAIRRVISGDDVHGEGHQQQDESQLQTQSMDTSSPTTAAGNVSSPQQPQAAVVVEHDPDLTECIDHDAPLDLIAATQPDRNNSDNFTTNSSLSDEDDDRGDDVFMEVEGSPTPIAGVGSGPPHHRHPPMHYQQHLQSESGGRKVQRMESSSDGSDSGSARATTTSQNSSRDWGWFEDVHQSGQLTPTGSLKNIRRPAGKDSTAKDREEQMHRLMVGLDPKDAEAVAAAMAVTAPTYVLEESLSSQRLWKDSAGKRPPQPVEERAFYEKMWAQNFAKSQVNYSLPPDVLTATTPISLSPFAEGMDLSPADAADGGDNYQQYNNGAGQNTHGMMMLPSSRGGDGKSHDGYGGDEENMRPGGGLKETPRPAPPSVLPPTHQEHINKIAKTESGENLTVLVRGDNVFGTTVSKSFALSDEKGGSVTSVVTVNISIASYRVVESRHRGKYAQFLVIYREGSIRDTIGVWKRYSDFEDLAKKVTQAHEGCASVIANMSPLAVTEEHEIEHLPNAITSWRLLKKRQRWFRCLDSGYLSLKVFLLERFLHDILFESSSPKLLREFVGVDESLSR